MTSSNNLFFRAVKGNPTDAEITAIGKALRQLAHEASTDTMPFVTNARNNWGDTGRQYDPIHAYSPTAYANLKD